MNIFEKLGFIEKEEAIVAAAEVTMDEGSTSEATANIESTENVVSEIYAQNDMVPNDNSIYAVANFIDTLPSEMTTAKKQSSVYGILRVTGKSVSNLVDDAKARIQLLCSARDKVVATKDDEISLAKIDIEELKKAIESANILIQNAEAVKETTVKSVSDEIEKIEELIKFCNGMEEK